MWKLGCAQAVERTERTEQTFTTRRPRRRNTRLPFKNGHDFVLTIAEKRQIFKCRPIPWYWPNYQLTIIIIALFASRCPFSDAKSAAAAGCPSEPRTAPPPSILGCVRPWWGSGPFADFPRKSVSYFISFCGGFFIIKDLYPHLQATGPSWYWGIECIWKVEARLVSRAVDL